MVREPEYGPTDIAAGPDTTGPREQQLITSVNDFDDFDLIARFDTELRFEFSDEIDAVQVLELLGDQVRSLRRQVAHTLRYVQMAAHSAHEGEVGLSKRAIIAHSGLAKQTILDMFKDDE